MRALGDDGGKVRGALERGFADYLDATAGDRKAAARSRSLSRFALRIATPVATRAAQQAIKRVLAEPERASGEDSAR